MVRPGRLSFQDPFPVARSPQRSVRRAATSPAAGGPPPRRRREWPRRLLLFVALLGATLAAYRPAWHGQPVWDDEGHLTRPDLRDAGGLRRIWLSPGATQQYYPVTHTAFWIQHRLWGADTLGYHVVNIVLHAASAFLVFLILRRIRAPGAVLAAAVFALHPMHVESVAWITELKNTLSGVLYLASAWLYLRFDETRRRGWYAGAAALFVLALFSKTVTATLPVALVIALWWQRGRLSWRRDVLPLGPWAAISAAAGLTTAAFERALIGARGADFELTAIERVLVAGRAIWFYLSKLVWPANLSFNYPRWEVSAAEAWQYLLPLAAAAMLAAAWRYRRRSRAPFAALLYFLITLSPALGFVSVYPFRFSFVADHFAYLASIGVIALAAGAVGQWSRGLHYLAILLIAAPLAVLTWRHSRQFADAETLYRTTLERNPESWLARNNLAALLLNGSPEDVGEAVEHLRESLRLRHENPVGHYNLALALQQLGRHGEAIDSFQTALAQFSAPPDAGDGGAEPGVNPIRLGQLHRHLGKSLIAAGRREEGLASLKQAIDRDPTAAGAYVELGIAYVQTGALDDALILFRLAQQLQPGEADHYTNVGGVLLQQGRYEEAVVQLQEAVRLAPRHLDASFNLALAYEGLGRPALAAAAYRYVLQLDPAHAQARTNLERLAR
jgi:tetratricopeptide (TPR) repeat protein